MADWDIDENGLAIGHHDRDGCRVVTLTGVLDLAMLGAQEREFLDLAAGAPGRAAVIDLSGVQFCDSTGLGVLVRAAKALWERGGTLRLASARPWVRKVIVTSGIHQALPVHPTLEAAVAAVARRDADEPPTA
ncbi:STAS domain-containing protein [Longispora sp. K20-0274]|uniref:STAS domain-containing protein n=1 Tax=Longispora sp. K20-0274 TaxID=3088255 RepID=UPI00399A4430